MTGPRLQYGRHSSINDLSLELLIQNRFYRHGADYSEGSTEVTVAETVTVRSTSDISLLWRDNIIERELCRRMELNFGESNIHVHSVIHLVFILRGFDRRDRDTRDRQIGRQIALF